MPYHASSHTACISLSDVLYFIVHYIYCSSYLIVGHILFQMHQMLDHLGGSLDS